MLRLRNQRKKTSAAAPTSKITKAITTRSTPSATPLLTGSGATSKRISREINSHLLRSELSSALPDPRCHPKVPRRLCGNHLEACDERLRRPLQPLTAQPVASFETA